MLDAHWPWAGPFLTLGSNYRINIRATPGTLHSPENDHSEGEEGVTATTTASRHRVLQLVRGRAPGVCRALAGQGGFPSTSQKELGPTTICLIICHH